MRSLWLRHVVPGCTIVIVVHLLLLMSHVLMLLVLLDRMVNNLLG